MQNCDFSELWRSWLKRQPRLVALTDTRKSKSLVTTENLKPQLSFAAFTSVKKIANNFR